ncbi:Glycoside hydrolase family 9 protein [Ignavibacterium album JCM 16511]|uniref:Endoglucanase n=1 Tax=Ignavibacterium album (strain DSM 19864 / JCM 16511 / NBRC 101810 / Mat9-16) TaxID=945713 RepID=I0AL80_IGNAJ|nr:glycoside hydrolase family 9 protein [Ignavibacterium album]AFH49737.1 Glycoside hydrolase family 9 protein [Ignavibacterium album JCM 16511]
MKIIRFYFIIVLSLLFYSCNPITSETLFLRLNQIGFLPGDFKTAIIISRNPFEEKVFTIKNSDDETIFVDSIQQLPFKLNSNFNYLAYIDFSDLNKSGEYFIEFQKVKSYAFMIDENVFSAVRDSLIKFFQVQRCGPTNPLLHNVCHLQDASKVIGYTDSTGIDLTGGWHDAGDYIKFLYTTSFTTYMLLFSYEFAPEKFSFDLDNDSVPDILQEARVGLDFLLRCNFAEDAFISQVQDDRDHKAGWRLPDEDVFTFDRPAFVKMNRGQIGLYAASLAIASRIWNDRFYDNEFSDKCLNTARKIFELRNSIDDFADDEKYYNQNEFYSKLALAAVEIFNSTNDGKYLKSALEYGKRIRENNWWSWGDVNALVFYKLAKYDSTFISRLKTILNFYQNHSDSNLFGEAHPYNWGTTHSLAGVVLSSILYKKLTDSEEFDKLAILSRDFILGRNVWGMSFIYNIGKNFPKRIHHHIAYFNQGYLPGAMVSGPAPDSLLKKFNLLPSKNEFTDFNFSAIYSDEFENYITNEPTISGNATALFIFGYYSN